jgi:hypothetical protein
MQLRLNLKDCTIMPSVFSENQAQSPARIGEFGKDLPSAGAVLPLR